MTTGAARPVQTRWVYAFGGGLADGGAGMKDLLGGKGANLAEMCHLGIPVPAGFTITTEMCTVYYKNKKKYPPEVKKQVAVALARLLAIHARLIGAKPRLGQRQRRLSLSQGLGGSRRIRLGRGTLMRRRLGGALTQRLHGLLEG